MESIVCVRFRGFGLTAVLVFVPCVVAQVGCRRDPVPVVQPMALSHQRHMQADMKCITCHPGAEEQAQAQFPTVADCMDCHHKARGTEPDEPKDGGIAADYCRALVDKDLCADATAEECRKATSLDPKNALAHYELAKVLVARGDCTGAKSEGAKLAALPNVAAAAKAQADEILKTCVQGKAVKAAGEGKGAGRAGK